MSSFNAADGGCAPSVGQGAAGAAGPSTGGAAPGKEAGATAAGLGQDPLAGIANCFQNRGLIDDLTITDTTQVVSTQLPAFPEGEAEDSGQAVGMVSISVPYESDFFTPFFNAPGRDGFGIDSEFSESNGATAFNAAGPAFAGGAASIEDFQRPLEYAEIGPATALPGAYQEQTPGGNRVKNRSAPQEPVEGMPAIWVLLLGVLGLIGSIFAVFSLVSIIVGLARRRAA